jgi:transcriptional regulator with XRE-family HTH domain
VDEKQTFWLIQVRRLATSGEAKAIREEAGLSIREVADAIDVSPSGLFRWENGKRTPRGEAAVRYAKFLERLASSEPRRAS